MIFNSIIQSFAGQSSGGVWEVLPVDDGIIGCDCNADSVIILIFNDLEGFFVGVDFDNQVVQTSLSGDLFSFSSIDFDHRYIVIETFLDQEQAISAYVLRNLFPHVS